MAAKKDQDLLPIIQRRYKEAKEYLDGWRNEAKECYRFVANEQWADEDLDTLRDEGRPVVTFNRISPFLNAVLGQEILNRMETRVAPREVADSAAADIASNVIKYVRDQANAEDEEHDAFADLAITGLGCTETSVYIDDDGEPQIAIDRVSPLEILYDPSARKKNLTDARYVIRERDLSTDEFKAMFGTDDLPAKTEDDWLTSGIEENAKTGDPEDVYSAKAFKRSQQPKRSVKVLEYQWFELERRYRYPDVSNADDEFFTPGEPEEKSSADYQRDRDKLDALDLTVVDYERRNFKRAFVCSDRVLEVEDCPCDRSFSYHFMSGWRHGVSGHFYGLVSSMRDPQRWANKFFSSQMDMINNAAGGGIVYETGTFVDEDGLASAWSSPENVEVHKDKMDKWRPKREVNFPNHVEQLMQFAIRSIQEVTGISPELLGMVNREQSAMVETSRKKSAYALLAPLNDAKRRYHKSQGKLLLMMIGKFLTNDRWIRISSEYEPPQHIQLTADLLGSLKYDMIVDESPISPNQKENVFMALTQLAPLMVGLGLPPPPEAIDYMPLPTPLITAWKQAIAAQNQPGPEQQLAMAGKQAEVEKTQAETAAKRAQAMLDTVKAMQQEGANPQEIQLKLQEQLLKAQSLEVQRENTMVQNRKIDADVLTKRMKSATDLAKMSQELTQARMQANRPNGQV